MLKKLPIGIHTLDKMIQGNHLYIDKTDYVYKLITQGVAFFFSRPRRFGKSLLINTLEEIFLGNKALFKGLKIYESDWKWEVFPVIRIDFSKQYAQNTDELIQNISKHLNLHADKYNITLSEGNYIEQFEELIRKMSEIGKVVILVDEYDKPIIDHITNISLAIEMREILKGFYTIVKAMDAHIKFVLLTGVSKFARAGVFSQLNHLNDITMDAKYSGMLGITQNELLEYFAEHIDYTCELKQLQKEEFVQKIQNWYNGYCFAEECTKVYNPFSTLLLFDKMTFKNYWFETGTPTFLIKLIKEKEFPKITFPIQVKEMTFSTYELEYLSIIPLLFQTGYLTIKNFNPEEQLFTLDFPNKEVKESFLNLLLDRLSEQEATYLFLMPMITALNNADFDEFFNQLQSFFSKIPYDLHIEMEKYYQTVFYCIFQLIGLKIFVEYKFNKGRIDVVIEDKCVSIFEFKFSKSKEDALEQIKDKQYYNPWLSSGKEIYLVGVNFEDKNIQGWVAEKLEVGNGQ